MYIHKNTWDLKMKVESYHLTFSPVNILWAKMTVQGIKPLCILTALDGNVLKWNLYPVFSTEPPELRFTLSHQLWFRAVNRGWAQWLGRCLNSPDSMPNRSFKLDLTCINWRVSYVNIVDFSFSWEKTGRFGQERLVFFHDLNIK